MFVVFFQNAKYRMKASTLQPTLYQKTWFYQLMAQVGKCSLNAGVQPERGSGGGIWHCDLWAMGSLLQAIKPLGDAWVPGPLLTLREPVWKILKPIFFLFTLERFAIGEFGALSEKLNACFCRPFYHFRHVLISLC